MLASNRLFGTMGSDRNQAEQRIQIESAEGAGVVADAQIAFPHQRLGREWEADRGNDDGDRRIRRCLDRSG